MSQESNFYDLEQVKSALSGRIDDFVMSLFPEAKKEASAYKIGGLDGRKGGSMMISSRSSNPGWFQDFADPDVKGRPWKLVSLVKGITLREGIQWLASLSIATKATPAAAPIASRPALATYSVGASAKTRVPTAVSAAPAVRSFLGPQRSAMSPVGICIAT